MQRRELDRDAGAVVDAAPGRRLADGMDRVLVVRDSSAPRPRPSSRPRRACRRNSESRGLPAGERASSASSIVSPVTNCSPIIRIAMSTPRRMTGSPARAIRRVSAAARLRSLTVEVSLPVTTRPQVAALTNSDLAAAEMRPPVALGNLVADQRIARLRYRECASSASARHISATPSWLESEYSCTSPSTPVPLCFARSASTSLRASFATLAFVAEGSRAASTKGGRHRSPGGDRPR